MNNAVKMSYFLNLSKCWSLLKMKFIIDNLNKTTYTMFSGQFYKISFIIIKIFFTQHIVALFNVLKAWIRKAVLFQFVVEYGVNFD